MENAVRPFMENKPAVYLLLVLLLTTGTYTVNDLVGNIYPDDVVVPVTPRPAPPAQAIKEVSKRPTDCQPLINKSIKKHEKKRHG